MTGRSTSQDHTRLLILAAEREAQMVSAFARMAITTIAISIFLLAGGINLPVAPVVLGYLESYALVSATSAVFSLKRYFTPWISLLFTAIDGISLALLIGFALRITGSPMNLHGAVPGFVFIFPILILATMRYTTGPTLVAFLSFAATWFVFTKLAGNAPPTDALPAGAGPEFFFGPVQNAARWGFLGIATLIGLLAVVRRRKTLEAAIASANKTANLSRYLPDRIAEVVAEQGIDALTAGKRQNATVLFADIRGFTGLSEQLTPEDISILLSEFRSIVATEIDHHAGVVDKFIGDAVMALFGVPDQHPNSEKSGLECAIRILDKIALWNETRQANQLPQIEVTIGVHCGEVFAGTVGTQTRMEFTVLGDAVNIAARLQELAKTTSSGLVVSQALLEKSGQKAGGQWIALENSAIRGRTGRISLFEYKTPISV